MSSTGDSIILRQIGWVSGISIVVGSIVGTGIFIAPSIVASFSSSILIVTILWFLGALLCIIGADIYGKLGELYPEGGGQYVYLKKCLGDKYSLLYGWSSFLIICPAMIASMALFLGNQLKIYFPFITPLHIKGSAILFVALFTIINCYGIEVAGGIQKIVVAIQIIIMLLLVFAALLFLKGSSPGPDQNLANITEGFSLKNGLLAFVAILWSFEGFNTLTFITNEIKDGYKNIRKLIFLGCGVAFIIYFLINYSVISYIPHDQLIDTPNIAVTLSNLAFGSKGKLIIFILTIIGIITTTHTSIVIGPRITRVLAEDGYMFSFLNRLHPVYTSPNNALIFQFALVVLYILIGSFESLITCFIIINWIFYCMVIFSFLKVKKLPDTNKYIPYKYSELLESIIFILLVFILIIGAGYNHLKLSIIGFTIFIVGIIVSSYIVKRRKKC